MSTDRRMRKSEIRSAKSEPENSAETSPTRTPSQPTFLGALRGVWLFTWKSQVTWRRLAIGGISLLALPLLVALTTSSPQTWAQSHRPQMGSPEAFLNGFSRRAARAGCPLQGEQRSELARIITEEFARMEGAWDTGTADESSFERQRQQQDECYTEIVRRARPVLGERQLAEFQSFQRRHRSQHAPTVGDQSWDRTSPFYHCLIDLYFFIVLPLACVRTCGALIRDELDADTLSFLTTRPLSRARLLVLKFLSQAAWLQIWLVVQALLIFAVGSFRTIPELGRLLPAFLGAQVLAVLAWSALGALLGQVSRRYMALALLYGAIVEMGIGRIPTNINTLSLMRHLKTLLGRNPALQSIYSWPTAGVVKPVLVLLIATGLFLTLAALLFTFREYHHTSEMQK